MFHLATWNACIEWAWTSPIAAALVLPWTRRGDEVAVPANVSVTLRFDDLRKVTAFARVLDAGMDIPSRDNSINPCHRVHPRESADSLSLNLSDAKLEEDGSYSYSVESAALHLALRTLMLRRERLDLCAQRRSPLDAFSMEKTASYLSGVARRVLHKIHASLWNETEVLAIERTRSDPRGQVRVWRTNWGWADGRNPLSVKDLLQKLDLPTKHVEEFDDLSQLAPFIEECSGSTAWHVVPSIVTDGSKTQVFFIGVPRNYLRNTTVDNHLQTACRFDSVVGAALYLLCSRVTRNIDRINLLSIDEMRVLAPPHDVAAVFLAHLLAPHSAALPRVNLVRLLSATSMLSYEGSAAAGQLAFGQVDHAHAAYFSAPIPFSRPRLLRKLLVASSEKAVVVADAVQLLGVALVEHTQDMPLVRFSGRGGWELRLQGRLLLTVDTNGIRLPEADDHDADLAIAFKQAFLRDPPPLVRSAVSACVKAGHGGLLVFRDPIQTARPESSAVTVTFDGKALAPDVVAALSKVDGAMVFDADGLCQGAGVILSPPPSRAPSPPDSAERGARYNAALQYSLSLHEAGRRHVIVVISEDGDVNLFPKQTDSI